MLIAVMSDRAEIQGRVPDAFEAAGALLIVETDDDSVHAVHAGATPEGFAALVVASGAEAVVCGPHITRESFTPIADACVTRYNGAGLDVLTAAHRADRGSLPIIPDYEGGTGCGSGTGECHEHDD